MVEHKKVCEAKKTKGKASLKASGDKLSDAQHRVNELELTKNTADRPDTKFDEAKKVLATSPGHVKHLEDRLAEQSYLLRSKEAEAMNERYRLSKPGNQVTSLSADVRQSRTQNNTDKGLLEGVTNALALHKTASQQCTQNYFKKH